MGLSSLWRGSPRTWRRMWIKVLCTLTDWRRSHVIRNPPSPGTIYADICVHRYYMNCICVHIPLVSKLAHEVKDTYTSSWRSHHFLDETWGQQHLRSARLWPTSTHTSSSRQGNTSLSPTSFLKTLRGVKSHLPTTTYLLLLTYYTSLVSTDTCAVLSY